MRAYGSGILLRDTVKRQNTARWKYSRHVQPPVPNTIPESFENQQLSTDSTSMEPLLIALQTTAETFHSIRFVQLLFLWSHSSQRRDSSGLGGGRVGGRSVLGDCSLQAVRPP